MQSSKKGIWELEIRIAFGYCTRLLYYILLLVFFIEQCMLSNYANDNNLSISGENKEVIKSMLLSGLVIVESQCFQNCMILNPGKCYFMCIGKNVSDSELLNLNDLNLKNCKEVEVLGITIDKNLNIFTLQIND